MPRNTVQDRQDLAQLGKTYGVFVPATVQGFSTPEMASDMRIAEDAYPTLLTAPSSGIPAWLTTVVDPDVIRIAIAPMRATEILGNEVKKGDWVHDTTLFPVAELTGETSSYGDWNNNGSTGANYTWVPRQAYHYQTITQWGEREVERLGVANIQYKNDLDAASIMVLNKFQNRTYFYGVAGMQNYGLLNDPSLPAAVVPVTKAAGGTGWVNATPTEILLDFQKGIGQLITQSRGLLNSSSAITVAMAPISEMYLLNANSFGVSAIDLIRKAFPNLRIVTAPEYATAGGNLVQFIAKDIDGQDVGYTAFTEKLRAHAIVTDLSAWKQKKSQGTWGAIIRQPLAYAQMLGV